MYGQFYILSRVEHSNSTSPSENVPGLQHNNFYINARSRTLFGWNVIGLFCAERFNCSINDLICGRLPIIINSDVRNSVDETTLDRVAFLRELIMIRASSLRPTLSGLLSSDELNDVISHVCTS